MLEKYADGAYDEKLKAKQGGGVFEELDDIGVVGEDTEEPQALEESHEKPPAVEEVDELK